ncbi:MAG: lamin tail domain-containing protein [Patescibacteria group bacterium]
MVKLRKITKQFLSLFMIAGLLVYEGILNISYTSATFSDFEIFEENTIVAGTLVFSASGSDFLPEVTASQDSFRTVGLLNGGTIPDFTYQIRVANATSTLCGFLELKDDISDTFMPLSSYLSATTTFSLKSGITFEARLTSSDESLSFESCRFDLIFTGWQNEFPDATSGFSHIQTLSAVITAGDLEFIPPPPGPGDVVINELMWMGSSGDSNDEWIELRNMKNYDIDLSNWDIDGAVSGSGHLEIPEGYTIKANGFFLITKNSWDDTAINLIADLPSDEGLTNKSGMSLLNTGEQLILKDNGGNVIDTAWQDGVAWPAGSNGTVKKSMERNDIPGDGTATSSWHTCVDASSTALYWDVGRTEMGTPGVANLSDENLIIIEPVEELAVVTEETDDNATTTEETTGGEETNATTTEETVSTGENETNATTTEEITSTNNNPVDNSDSSSGEENASTTDEVVPETGDNGQESAPPENSDNSTSSSAPPVETAPAITTDPAAILEVVPTPDAGGGDGGTPS